MKINFDSKIVKQFTPQLKEKVKEKLANISQKAKTLTPEQAAACKANIAKLPADFVEKLKSLKK